MENAPFYDDIADGSAGTAHWITTGLPITIAALPLGYLLNLPTQSYPWLIASLALGTPAVAQDRAAVERQFRDWLEQTVWPRARSEGVSRGTFEAAFSGVALDWDLPDLVPPGSAAQTPKRQRQAEFGKPGKYFGRGAVDGATATGRQMARRHKSSLFEGNFQPGDGVEVFLG